MRKFLLLLLLFPLFAHANNYYFSESTGNDSRTAAQAQNPATPWQTMNKASSYFTSLNAGDSLLFKRGEIFTGTGIYAAKSGTSGAHIVIGAYGTGNAPVFLYDLTTPMPAANRTIIYIPGNQYIDIQNIKMTDATIDSTNHSINSNVGYGIGMSSGTSYIGVSHVEVSLLGIAAEPANNCTFQYDNFHNMRMVVNTPTPSNDDYGANGIVITGSNNLIEYCHFTACWATSYDYGYDGGAIEVYGNTVNGNTIMYNICINNNGFLEAGSSGTGVMSNNIIAYNLLINQGGTLMLHTASGSFHIGVSNLQLYNNDIIETVVQYAPSPYMINCASFTPPSNPVVVMRNNIFWMTTSIGVAQPGGFLANTPASFMHTNNLYHLAGIVGYTLGLQSGL